MIPQKLHVVQAFLIALFFHLMSVFSAHIKPRLTRYVTDLANLLWLSQVSHDASHQQQMLLGTLQPIAHRRADTPFDPGHQHPETETEHAIFARIEALEDKDQETLARVEKLECALNIVSDGVDILGQADKVRADCEEA